MAAVTTAATGGDGIDPSGGLTPVVSAGHPPPPRTEDGALDEAADMVERLNERYMVAKDGGKAVVLEPGRDPVHAHRLVFDKLTFADFKGLWQNRRINCGTGANGKPIWRSVGEVWLGHPDRRQFIGGIVFDPTGQRARPDQLNLWRGWAVEPRPGDWSRLRNLIERVLCADDRTKSELLLSWIARMFQRPAEHGEVAVVIRGGEGTGKGTLARVLMRIAGQHALAVSDAKHLTGAFNSHLRGCVFLHADEAFFAGDPSHLGVLKALITEPYLMLEAKHRDAAMHPNFLHILMTSNERWVVPASLQARRYFLLDTPDDKRLRKGSEYFDAIWAEIENGGYEGFLWDMLQRDISEFNWRAAPETAALEGQKLLSLDVEHAWWLDCLSRGYVLYRRGYGSWKDAVPTDVLYDSYQDFAEKRRERRVLDRMHFGRFMGRFAEQHRSRTMGQTGFMVGTEIGGTAGAQGASAASAAIPPGADGTAAGTSDAGASGGVGKIVRGYLLASLDQARAEFQDVTQLKQLDWGNLDTDDVAKGLGSNVTALFPDQTLTKQG